MIEALTKSLLIAVRSLDRTFDCAFSSKYNPLHRSGTIAVIFLTIATATGTYLLFWYRLSTPYDSMLAIEAATWGARWVRNLHRVTSDLSVLIVIYHVLRMFAERKSWGPRFLAWVTGTVLTLLMFIVGWTGLILVWDQSAIALARSGAQMLNQIPLFSETILRSISGAAPIGTSFFFMNLFLHMSIPLGMIFLLWLHTSNLNKPAWFPDKKYSIATILILVIFSIAGLAPLGPQADPLQLDMQIPINAFYTHLIPMVNYFGPTLSIILMVVLFVIVISAPAWTKPKPGQQPKTSVHNPKACTGCGQCVEDCPFDAISMIARIDGDGSPTVASVNPDACVGCGICSGSCSQMAIGPEEKSARHQMQIIKDLKGKYAKGSELIIRCINSRQAFTSIDRPHEDSKGSAGAIMAIECAGELHIASAAFALDHFSKIAIHSCPQHACVNRLGASMLTDRFLNQRPPEAPKRLNWGQISVVSDSSFNIKQPKRILKALSMSAAILIGSAFLSAIPYKISFEESVLRVALRIPGQAIEVCRDRSAEEIAGLPFHMRTAKECKRTAVSYSLEVKVNEQIVVKQQIEPGGARSDKPLIFEQDFRVKPGQHEVSIAMIPSQNDNNQALVFSNTFNGDFTAGRALLLGYDSTARKLFLSPQSIK